MPRDENPTVYSTDPNFAKPCPRCGRIPCRCPKPASLPPSQQTAGLVRDRKGRGGKTVTIVRDLKLKPDDLKDLAKKLKQVCGSGGTIKEGTIEIQGDHRDQIAEYLKSLGYKTKMIGG